MFNIQSAMTVKRKKKRMKRTTRRRTRRNKKKRNRKRKKKESVRTSSRHTYSPSTLDACSTVAVARDSGAHTPRRLGPLSPGQTNRPAATISCRERERER